MHAHVNCVTRVRAAERLHFQSVRLIFLSSSLPWPLEEAGLHICGEERCGGARACAFADVVPVQTCLSLGISYFFLYVPLPAQGVDILRGGVEWTNKMHDQCPEHRYISRRTGFEMQTRRWSMHTYGCPLNTFLFTCHVNNTINIKKKVWGSVGVYPALSSASSLLVLLCEHH